MATQGTVTVDFGAFPGSTDVISVVTGQASILTTNSVEAWPRIEATADHPVDDIWIDPPIVYAGDIVAATGFTIYVMAPRNGKAWGEYKIDWVWN